MPGAAPELPASAPPASGAARQSVSRLTLRLRLTLWIMAINTAIVWMMGAALWLTERWTLDQSLNARRIERLQIIAAGLAQAAPADLQSRLESIHARLAEQFIDEQVQISISDGRAIVASMPEPIPELRPTELSDAIASGRPRIEITHARLSGPDAASEPVRIAAVPLRIGDAGAGTVFLAVTDRFAQRQLRQSRNMLLVIFALAPLAAAGTAWYLARIAIAPLDRLRLLASRIPFDPGVGSLVESLPGSSAEVMTLVKELDLALARVRSRHAAQERFLYNVSHELKTPIAVVMAEAQTIDRAGLPPSTTVFIESVEEEMFRLGRIIEGLLALSRVQNGEGLRRVRRYAVMDLVMDSIENCRELANRKGVRLSPSLEQREEPADDAVIGDPELLRIMLDRLVRDAVRHSPGGSVVTISAVRSSAATRGVEITIDDSGAGIPPERAAANPDAMVRASDQPEHERGGGLSLTVAQAVAQLHRGTVTIRNREPAGCRVCVTLPLYNGGAQAGAPTRHATNGTANTRKE
ncbi:two-component system, OmpR family, sensor histidine kinase TctE [Phycisphaerales bacterium]|nr:two-component system, OmpR family, sensor histidine kinase TctE [Phycisphaerales bacterium]